MTAVYNDWVDRFKEGQRVYMAFACIDYVGSTSLWDVLEKSEVQNRFDFYRDTADRIFESYGGVGKGWHGEGNVYFFGDTGKNIDEDATKAAVDCLLQLKTGIDVEIPVRISISSGLVEYKKDFGKMDCQDISFCGHLNSACPENAILITENIYFALPQKSEIKDKFVLCGTTQRDKVVTFIYPKDKKGRKGQGHFLQEDRDWASDYKIYMDSMEKQCETLTLTGVRQAKKFLSLELTEAFIPLKLKESGSDIDRQDFSRKIEFFKDKNERYFLGKQPKISLPLQEGINFIDVFKRERHLVILGDPGSGKTTLLKWLCLLYSRGLKSVIHANIDEEFLFPVLVPLSALYLEKKKKEHVNPIDAISKYYEDMGVKNLAPVLEEKLEKGRCILLLDGLDEIPDAQDKFLMARYIENFVKRYEQNRFLITSRIVGYTDIKLPTLKSYTLCPLKDKDIQTFVLNWFMAFEKGLYGDTPVAKEKAKSEAKQLYFSILQDAGIKKLAVNPFLLTLICIIQKEGHTLPKYRVELYRLCMETLFETWLEARNLSGRALSRAIDYKEGEKILAPLSLWLHEKFPKGMAKKDDIERKIIQIMKERGSSEDEARKSTSEFFRYLAEQTQLFVDKGGEYYGYSHLTFQEYLAGRAIVMQEEQDQYIKKYSYNSRWTEVFMLMAGWIGIVDGREKEVTRIVEILLKSKKKLEDFFHKDLLLAGKIVVENPGITEKTKQKVIRKICVTHLYTPYEELHQKTTDIIFKILEPNKSADIYRKFLKRLFDKKEGAITRIRIVGIIVSARYDNQILKALREILNDRTDKGEVRGWAAAALCFFAVKKQDSKTLDKVLALLKDRKEDKKLRGFIMGIIPLFTFLAKDENKVLEILGPIAKDQTEEESLRRDAALFLWLYTGGKQTKEILLTIVKDKTDGGKTRASMITILSYMLKENNEILETLLAIMKDKTEPVIVRISSIESLAPLSENKSEVLGVLQTIVKDKTEDKAVRISSIESLAPLSENKSEILEMLQTIAKDKTEDETLRVSSATATADLVRKNKRFLETLLTDKKQNWRVRIRVAGALLPQMKKNETILRILIAVIKDKRQDESVRIMAANMLLPLAKKDKTILNMLLSVCKDLKNSDLFKGLWDIYV